MQQHLGTLVGRKVLLFDSLGTLEAKSERLYSTPRGSAAMASCLIPLPERIESTSLR
jgi:hypothetical protein